FVNCFAAWIARLPVGRHPAMFFSPEMEGYIDYCFGGRAGPDIGISHLCHELAHAAEFGPDTFKYRAYMGSFRFKMRKIFVIDRYCIEPDTNQATLREIRTFAHQLNLMRLMGFKGRDE